MEKNKPISPTDILRRKMHNFNFEEYALAELPANLSGPSRVLTAKSAAVTMKSLISILLGEDKFTDDAFYMAILKNNLKEAVYNADDLSILTLRLIMIFLANNVPVGLLDYWRNPQEA